MCSIRSLRHLPFLELSIWSALEAEPGVLWMQSLTLGVDLPTPTHPLVLCSASALLTHWLTVDAHSLVGVTDSL